MTRSVWKGPFVDSHLLKKVKAASDSGGNSVIKTWSRRSTILPEFVGVNFAVHNGKRFIPVNVTEDMVCLLYTSPSPRDKRQSRMPSSA